MWCSIKFVKGHMCVRSQFYQLLVEDEEEDGLPDMGKVSGSVDNSEPVELIDAEEGLKLVISLNALLGTGDSQTMRLQGKVKNLPIIILVDSGSTHNFINQNVVKQVGFPTQVVDGISVSVANGDKMWVKDVCVGVQWEAGEVT